jgi:hypothetical protein
MTASDAIGRQFRAAIQSLDGAITACPDAVWAHGEQWRQPWYLAFHTLFWLGAYLSESPETYTPPQPFTRGELEAGVFPERAYRKDELLGWVGACREALEERLATITTAEGFGRPCQLRRGPMAAGELVLYNMRHVQHHAAQINLLVRQAGVEPSGWVRAVERS